MMSFRMQEVCDWLESHIDPFDLDVFTPPLNANLNRLSQKTSVIYLKLLSIKKKGGLNEIRVLIFCTGAVWAGDWLREAVCPAEQQRQHTGALQHPSAGQHSNQV